MIILFGLPGTGKTTIAKALAQQLHAPHFNSDTVRNTLGLRGRYSAEDKQRVYDHLLECTRQALSEGKTVVTDGTFFREAVRMPFRSLATACDTAICWVEVKASEDVLWQRLQQPRDDSEADFGVYERVRDQFEPLAQDHLTVETDKMTLSYIIDTVRSYCL